MQSLRTLSKAYLVALLASNISVIRLRVGEQGWRDLQPMRARDSARRFAARKHGYAEPPQEVDCPPRPADSQCQRCGHLAALIMDHDHGTGHFRGWICYGCNIRVEKADDELTRAYLALTIPGFKS